MCIINGQGVKSFLSLRPRKAQKFSIQKKSGNIWKNSEKFGKVQKNLEYFGTIWKTSEIFGKKNAKINKRAGW